MSKLAALILLAWVTGTIMVANHRLPGMLNWTPTRTDLPMVNHP